MAKIAKILVTENKETFELYPVTSVKAVYDENDERLDSLLDKKVDIIHNGTFTVTKAYQAVFSVPFGTRAVFVVNQGGQSDLETLTLNAVSSTYSTLYTTNKDTLFYMDIWGVSGKCVVYMKNNGGVENSINLYYLSCAADKANWSPTGSYTDESNLAKAVTYWDTSISEKFATYTYTSSDSSLTINRSTTSANFMVNFAGDAFKNAVETNVNTVIGMTDTQVVNENLEPEAEVEVFGNTVPLGVVTKKSGTETVYTSAPEYKIYTHELPQNSDIYSHWYRMNLPMSGQMKVDITANINGGKVQGSIECCSRDGNWLMYASNATIAKYTRWTNTNGYMAMFIANYYYKTDYSLRVHRYDQTIGELSTDDFMPILATASEIEALQEMICLKEAAIDTTKWITISSDNYSATQAFVKSNPNYILAQSTKYSFTDALTDSFVMQFVTQVEGATISIYDKDGNLKTTSPQMSKTSECILNYNVTDDTFTWSEEAMSVAPVTVSLNEGTQYGSDVFGNVDVTVPGAIVNIVNKKLDTDKVCVSDEFGNIVVSTISKNELSTLDGIRSNIQDQIDAIIKFNNGVNNSIYNYYCDGTMTFDDSTTATGYVYSNAGLVSVSNDTTSVIVYSGYITNKTAFRSDNLYSVICYNCDLKTDGTSASYNFKYFLYGKSSLKTVGLTGFDFSKITSMQEALMSNQIMNNVQFRNPDFSSCSNFTDMFADDISLTELNLNPMKIKAVVNDATLTSLYFYRLCIGDTSLKTVYLGGFTNDIGTVLIPSQKFMESLSFSYAFNGCTSLTKVVLTKLTVTKSYNGAIIPVSFISDISHAFEGCSALQEIDILNTCIGRQRVHSADDAYYVNFQSAFKGCSSLINLSVNADFETINNDKCNLNDITNYYAKGYGVKASAFDHIDINNCSSIFEGCSSLSYMCFNPGRITANYAGAFANVVEGCTSLKMLYITTREVINGVNDILLLSETLLPDLVELYINLPDNNSISINIACCPSLSYYSIAFIIEHLHTVDTGYPKLTLTVNASVFNLMTTDQKTLISSKRWNLVSVS